MRLQGWLRGLVLFGSLGCYVLSAQGQGPEKVLPGTCQGASATLDIVSERMTFEQRTRTFTFEENVRVRRCTMIMTCERLHVINDAKGDNVEHITATGAVHVQQGARHITAERAEYFPAEQRLVFTGHPRAWDTQEQREITGEEITVFLQNDNVYVKRAHVLFTPPPTATTKRP